MLQTKTIAYPDFMFAYVCSSGFLLYHKKYICLQKPFQLANIRMLVEKGESFICDSIYFPEIQNIGDVYQYRAWGCKDKWETLEYCIYYLGLQGVSLPIGVNVGSKLFCFKLAFIIISSSAKFRDLKRSCIVLLPCLYF